MKYLLYIIIVLISCENKENPKNIILNEDINEADQTIEGLYVEFIDSSKIKAKLRSDFGYLFEQRRETYIKGNVKIEFFSKFNNDRVSVMTSDSAKIDDKTKNMYAYSRVIVVSDSTSTTLKTNYLEWVEQTKRLYSNDFVRIENDYEIIEGFGFESDQNLENYQVYKVKGVKRK